MANTTDIEKAIYFCKGANNIAELNVYSLGEELVVCKNTESARLNDVKLP